MRIYDGMKCFGSRVSPRMWVDNNGQLICVGAIVARTGAYKYLESEIEENGDPNTVVEVFRTPEEVFNPVSMASFENKPFCDDHPDDNVTLKNYKDLQKGFIRNIRRGTGELKDCLLADIVVTDEDTINEIRRGDKRELSLGYDTELQKDSSGRWIMKNIRGNHLALVDSGRAGCATIRDSASKIKNSIGGNNMKLFGKTASAARHRLYDEDIIKVEELVEDDEDIQLEELPEAESEEQRKPAPSEDVIDEDIPEAPGAQVPGDDEHDKPLWDAIEALRKEIEALKQMIGGQRPETAEPAPMEDDVDDILGEAEEDEFEEPESLEGEEEPIEEDEDKEEGELLDADECEIQSTLEEPIRDRKTAAKDARSTYAKFANVSDAASTKLSDAEQTQLLWQQRYDSASKKIK